MSKISKAREQECKDQLRKWLKPGDTVYTLLKHVSRSGMYRAIDLYIIRDNRPFRISGWAADLLEGYDERHEACRASGCGMDMGFHLVYNLSYVLFHDYECMADALNDSAYRACPSPDHVNCHVEGIADKRGLEVMHHDGYALRQEWM